MSRPTETRGQNTYIACILDFLLSTYLALLTISLNIRMTRLAWSTKLHRFYFSQRYPNAPRGIDDPYREALAVFLVVWFFAFVIFALLRLTARFSSARAIVRNLSGLVAVAGFPLACLYSGEGRLFVLEL
jgi:hypothetical protein